jgi:trans-2,3-dihydro-3-hydroxyanthranilate isomerase
VSQSRAYQFVQVDVFTNQIFGGNPLAVFLDARGLSDVEMQTIAMEMNLSETTFVLPPEDASHAARVRIFTPTAELPFAGHPTIGTSWVLRDQGRIPADATSLVLELGLGPISVRVEQIAGTTDFLWMDQGSASFGPPFEDRAAVAEAIGVAPDDLLPNMPIQPASTGSPFLYVPLRNKQTVDRVAPRLDAYRDIVAQVGGGVRSAFFFAPEAEPGRVYSRMIGIGRDMLREDPATGSANGPLGAYLVKHGIASGAGIVKIISEQGTAMGRQSFIHLRVAAENGQAGRVEVGGQVVPVFEGVLRL